MQSDRLKRREFITLLSGATAFRPLVAPAQQTAGIRRVGVLLNLSENDVEAQRLVKAFREGLAQLGWADGRNLRIDYRWAGGDVGRIVQVLNASTNREIEAAFTTLVRDRADALFVATGYSAAEASNLRRSRRAMRFPRPSHFANKSKPVG
jgi:hypothetical protein